MVTASQVKDLREKTGAGMMDCKKVLTETDGDMEKAMELLRERGIAKAEKKSGRIASEGLVADFVSADRKVGAIVEVNSETDFVAKNNDFKTFVNDVAKIVAEKNPVDVDALLNMKYLETEKTVQEVLTDKIATIGENINIRRFERYETEGLIETYVHGEGKIAVMVDFSKGDKDTARDICMQIAASRPDYVQEAEVPEDVVNKEMEILKAQAMNEGKPADIAEKMVKGRIGKFYGDVCLVDQLYVKNPDMKVSEYLKSKDSEITKFVRFEKGEGIEKKEENFAEEVMKQLK